MLAASARRERAIPPPRVATLPVSGELREALTAAKSGYWAQQVEIQQTIVGAWLAKAEGKQADALALMRSAADLEDTTEKHPVTPGLVAPARELLGDMLLEANQPAEALKAYERSIAIEPNRFRALYGAGRAAELAGDRKRGRTYYTRLVSLADGADAERREIRQAKAFLDSK